MNSGVFLAGLMVLVGGFASSAFGQATRTWVSGVGDDVNPASRTAPAKTFAGAISKTAAGGEISVLDPGGYGAVTILKSITIDGGSLVGSILASGTVGITIQAGPEGVVTLRNLSINGAGTGTTGIRILSARKVIVENCVIAGFADLGIELNSSSGCTLVLNRVSIQTCGAGLVSRGASGSVVATECRLQNLKAMGIWMVVGHAAVTRTVLSDCQVAVSAAAGASVLLAETTITGNRVALEGPGTISSLGNNGIAGNGAPGPAPTIVRAQ